MADLLVLVLLVLMTSPRPSNLLPGMRPEDTPCLYYKLYYTTPAETHAFFFIFLFIAIGVMPTYPNRKCKCPYNKLTMASHQKLVLLSLSSYSLQSAICQRIPSSSKQKMNPSRTPGCADILSVYQMQHHSDYLHKC